MSADTTNSSTFQLRWYFSVAAVLFIFAIVGMYSLNMARNTTGYDDEQAKQRLQKLAATREQDGKTLTTADWIDKTKGVVRIPIDEAMPQEVALLKAKPIAMGTNIPGASAAPLAQNTIPATNSPTASANPSGTVSNAPTAQQTPPNVTGTPPASTNAPSATTNQPPTGGGPANSKPTK